MKIRKLINEYNNDKNKVKELEQIMWDKRTSICFNNCYVNDVPQKRPKYKCIDVHYAEIDNYGEWPLQDNYVRLEYYCPKFDEKNLSCSNQKCAGYKNYMEYCTAKQNYSQADNDLWKKYPIFIMILAGLQRKFQRG